jgi:hypothetical protein
MNAKPRRHPAAVRRGKWAAVAVLLLAAALPLRAQYDPKLQYQNRGNRHEGLKPKPVSGYDIELLSALVEQNREPFSTWPPEMRLKFYLPADQKVAVTVRQLRPKTYYYWLDEVQPAAPWKPQAFNEFPWPTDTVLRNLSQVTPDDLGAVVRLGTGGPAKIETIAPAALFQSRGPKAATGYRFTFKTNGRAYVTARIYRGDKEVYVRRQNEEKAGSPFTLAWEAGMAPEDDYRVVISGYYSDNTPLAKEVRFHHRATWP